MPFSPFDKQKNIARLIAGHPVLSNDIPNGDNSSLGQSFLVVEI